MALVGTQIKAVVSVEGADKAKSDLQETGKSAEQTKQSFGEMMKQGLANAASFAVFNVGAKALGFLKDQFTDTLQVAIQHQDVLAQTAQVIKSTGGAAGLSANQISDLASSLSKVTTFSQDATEQGENLLLTFTGIGKDVFPMATKTMLDMSQAMGQDVKSSAIQLGKALNDPAQGLTALTRVGVTFTDKQKEMIQKMVAVGDTAGAQKIMLAELQREFGGSAEAAGKTFGGQLKILQNNLDDVRIKIGTALLPILTQFTGWISTTAMPLVNKFSDWFAKTGAPAIQNFGNFISQNVVPAVKSFGDSITPIIKHVSDWFEKHQVLQRAIKALSPILSDIGSIIKNLSTDVGNFIKKVADWAEKHHVLETSTTAVKTVLHDIKEAIKAVSDVVGPIIDKIKDWTDKHDPLKTAINKAKDAIKDAKTAIDNTKTAIKDIVDWFNKWKPVILSIAGTITGFFVPAMIKAGIEATVSGAKITTSFVQSIIKSGYEAVINGAKVTIQFVQSMIKAGVEAVVNGAKITVSFVASIIKTGIEGWKAAANLAIFIGGVIKSGIESAIAGAKIALNFVGNIIKAGVECAIAGGKIAISFISNVAKAGVECAIAGGKIAISFISNVVKAGVESAIAGGKVLVSFVASMVTAGAQAIITGAQMTASFIAGLITAGAEAIVSAGIFLSTLVPSLLAVAAATIAATWPYLLIAAIVAAVVAGIVLAVMHWGEISNWLLGVWNGVVVWFQGFWHTLQGIFGGIGQWFHDKWQSVVDGFHSVLGGLGAAASGIFNSVTGAVKAGFNTVIDLVNGVIKGINSISVAGFGVHIPLIPHLAKGGLIAQAGIALVGEQGPELVALPQGARVIPNNQIASFSQSSSQGGSAPIIHIHNYIDGKEITDNAMNRVIKSTRVSGPIRSNVS